MKLSKYIRICNNFRYMAHIYFNTFPRFVVMNFVVV